jgi:hypothetical protein
MFPYYFIRFSGPLLLILVGLKILSGYSLVEKMGATAPHIFNFLSSS